jgi:hypothetical protein
VKEHVKVWIDDQRKAHVERESNMDILARIFSEDGTGTSP